MADSGSYTPETIARRQQIAEALLSDAMKPRKMRHWAEGLGQLGQAAFAGFESGMLDKQQREGEGRSREFIASLLSGGGTPAAAEAPVAAPAASSPAPAASAPLPPIKSGPTEDIMGYPVQPRTAPATPPNMALPRGIRNNNPLNIEAGGFTQGQPGFSGSDGRFARFDTPESGVAAASKLIDVYGQKHGLNTVAGIVGRWAPAGDGNNVSAYAANVARQMGVDPNAPLDLSDPKVKSALIGAMGQHENGRPIQMAALTPSGQTMTDTTAPAGAPAAPPAAAPAVAAALNAPAPAPAAAAPGANPMTTRIAEALRSKDPYLAKAAQGIAGNLVAQQFKTPEYTRLNDEQILEKHSGKVVAAGAAYKPIVDPAERAAHGIPADDKRPYQLGPGNKLINPPAETRVSIDQKGESAFDTTAGQVQAKRFDELASDGQSAKQMMSDLEVLSDLGKNISTGKVAEAKAVLGPYAEALGIKIDKLSDIQAYDAIVNRVAPNLRVKGSGAQSDYELKNFLKSLPALGDTTEGNEIKQATLQGLYENKIKAAEIGSKAINKEITRAEADKQLRELPDPMQPYRDYMKKTRGAPTAGGVRKFNPDTGKIE